MSQVNKKKHENEERLCSKCNLKLYKTEPLDDKNYCPLECNICWQSGGPARCDTCVTDVTIQCCMCAGPLCKHHAVFIQELNKWFCARSPFSDCFKHYFKLLDEKYVQPTIYSTYTMSHIEPEQCMIICYPTDKDTAAYVKFKKGISVLLSTIEQFDELNKQFTLDQKTMNDVRSAFGRGQKVNLIMQPLN